MEAPLFGPHDADMDIKDFMHCTLSRVADNDEELQQFASFILNLRRDCKAFDVGALMELSLSQIMGAAEAAVGINAARGTARLLLKYLGSRGCPHQPPNATNSEGMLSFRLAADAQILFGRAGKGATDSMESNFPDAMRPSKTTDLSGPPRLPVAVVGYIKENLDHIMKHILCQRMFAL